MAFLCAFIHNIHMWTLLYAYKIRIMRSCARRLYMNEFFLPICYCFDFSRYPLVNVYVLIIIRFVFVFRFFGYVFIGPICTLEFKLMHIVLCCIKKFPLHHNEYSWFCIHSIIFHHSPCQSRAIQAIDSLPTFLCY